MKYCWTGMAKTPCYTSKASPLVKLISVLWVDLFLGVGVEWGGSSLSMCLLGLALPLEGSIFPLSFLAIYEVVMGEYVLQRGNKKLI